VKRPAKRRAPMRQAPTLRHGLYRQSGEQAMEHIGIDVHKSESQVCVLGEGARWYWSGGSARNGSGSPSC
jgi:hypothetical protein